MDVSDLATLQNLKDLGNSAFTTSLVGALAGAYAGAKAAQIIAERGKQSDLLIAEFRNTNSALMLAVSICNISIAFKKQHSLPLLTEFNQLEQSFRQFHAQREADEIPPEQPFRFSANFRSVPTPVIPLRALENVVFDRLSAVGRPLSLVAELSAQISGLAATIALRANYIPTISEKIPNNPGEAIALYFGLPMQNSVDTRYKDAMEALLEQSDYLIFFSQLLCNDLTEHGVELKERARRLKLKVKLGDLVRYDFSVPQTEGLMPDPAKYESWIKGFVKAPKQPGRWQRLLNWLGLRRSPPDAACPPPPSHPA